jgi:hypothetical protein
MATWRKLHTKIVESLDVNDMPDDFTRLVWAFLPLGLDKEGRCLDNPSFVKAKIMPLRDDVAPKRMKEALDWFAERGMIVRYEVAGRAYFYVPTFGEYQGDTSRECKSNYPAPQDQGAQTSCSPHADYKESACKGHVNVAQTSRTDVDVDSAADSDSDTDAATAADAERAGAPVAAAVFSSEDDFRDLAPFDECADCLKTVLQHVREVGFGPSRALSLALEFGPYRTGACCADVERMVSEDARNGTSHVRSPSGLLVTKLRQGDSPPVPTGNWFWQHAVQRCEEDCQPCKVQEAANG